MTVLWRVCQLLLAHVRLQVDERDDTFVAVGRARGGNGWLRICRHGLEKVLYSFSSSGADVDVQGLHDREFSCAVWRAGDAARDAGAMAGGGCGVMGGLGSNVAVLRC